MARSRCRITEPDRPHFVTCTALAWLPVLTRPETVGILLDALVFTGALSPALRPARRLKVGVPTRGIPAVVVPLPRGT